jgi:sialidase-1
MLRQTDIFLAGSEGYHTYRIPALAVTQHGTILAFCEGRRDGRGDAGKIDLLLRRSTDGGATWRPTQVVVTEGDNTCGNPCPVVDQSDGTIWLPFCKNLGEGHEGLIIQGKAPRTVWLTRSTDDGITWSEPREITQSVKRPSWTWYATGPTHGIQLETGRLVVPCDHARGVNLRADDPRHSHVIISDDHGMTWRTGGIVGEGTDESAIVVTDDGALYINCRGHTERHSRGFAWSRDQGDSFGEVTWDDRLVEPRCQGSLVRFTSAATHDRNRVLFSNPASTERVRMTIRMSYDECRTWPVARVLNEGPSAYSDLCIARDATICCLYERGKEHPYEKIALARFDLAWLTDGNDHPERSL